MPCYTAWNDFLKPDTPEYQRAEQEVQAKLKAIKHIIDYYYRAFQHKLPNLPDGTVIDQSRQPRSSKEATIREMICHHFACDEVDFCTLYDVCSLLKEENRRERSYLAVILPCAHMLRSDPGKYFRAQ